MYVYIYIYLSGMVDTIFADVAQPDQARIVSINAQSFLKNQGHFVISIKVPQIRVFLVDLVMEVECWSNYTGRKLTRREWERPTSAGNRTRYQCLEWQCTDH